MYYGTRPLGPASGPAAPRPIGPGADRLNALRWAASPRHRGGWPQNAQHVTRAEENDAADGHPANTERHRSTGAAVAASEERPARAPHRGALA